MKINLYVLTNFEVENRSKKLSSHALAISVNLKELDIDPLLSFHLSDSHDGDSTAWTEVLRLHAGAR